MSNVKSVLIRGRVPYNTGEYPKLNEILGQLNAPSFGLRISYGDSKYVPNEHGGKTAMYEFTIEGNEGVRREWVRSIEAEVKAAGGWITGSYCRDLDNRTTLWDETFDDVPPVKEAVGA